VAASPTRGVPWVLEVSKHSELDIDRQNAERSRRGRNNRSRGNAIERWVCEVLGIKRVGMFGGKADGGAHDDWIVVQVKSGKSYPERLDSLLNSIPARAGQLRAVVNTDAPGAGTKRRAMITMSLDDFIAWFGKEHNGKEEAGSD